MLSLLTFSPIVSYSQLLQSVSSSQANFTANESSYIQNVLQESETKSVSYVSIGDVASFQANGNFDLSIPGVAGIFPTEAVRVEYVSPTDFIWSGKFTTVSGYFSLISKPEGQTGFIQIQGQFFNIMPLRGNLSILREQNLEAPSDVNCVTPESPETPAIDFCANENNNCLAEIDVLILVNDDIQTFINNSPNPWQVLLNTITGIESVNLAFANSGIPNKRIRWQAMPFSFTFPSPFITVQQVVTSVGSFAIQAASLRASTQADVVILLTAIDLPGVAGIANCVGPSSNCGFGFVEIQNMVGPRWTFAHEFAHLLGAHHNRTTNCSMAGVCGDDNAPVCGHGLVFQGATDEHRTILSRFSQVEQDAGIVRILHYSNPDIEFDGAATGDALNDNARLMRNGACFVANYGSSQWSAGIDAIPSWCPSIEGPMSATSIVNPPTPGWNYPGLPPYTFQWKWNNSPTYPATGNDWGTQPSITISSPPATPNFWIFLRVTSSDGQVITSNQKVKVGSAINCAIPFSGGDDRSTEWKQDKKQSTFFPNPVADLLTVKRETESPISIFDMLGKAVFISNDQIRSEQTINVSNLFNGVYFIQIDGRKQTLIIQKD